MWPILFLHKQLTSNREVHCVFSILLFLRGDFYISCRAAYRVEKNCWSSKQNAIYLCLDYCQILCNDFLNFAAAAATATAASSS